MQKNMKQQEGINLPPRSGKLLNLLQGAVDRAHALMIQLAEMERELAAVQRERDTAEGNDGNETWR